jgi:hypothetical protein
MELDFMDVRYPIQVRQKDRVSRPEIGAYFKKSGKSIIALTVQDILDGDIAQKLA